MTLQTIDTLPLAEHERLGALEARIAAGLQTFHEVGSALLEIRDARLYRASHGTFEDYCRERWGFVASRARQLISAAELAGRVESVTNVTLANEGQARALGQFDADLQPDIMRHTKRLSEETGKPITAGFIERVGDVFEEARLTGHVDIGDGTSTPLEAALTVEAFEHMQRQKEHIRSHYEEHDARGHVTPEAQEKRAHVAHNSGNNEWYTPPEFTRAAHRVMGGIDLDPASSDTANRTVGATVHFTAEDDGLARAWGGRVFLNPPYSGDLVGRFAAKALEEIASGNVPEAIVLVNNATETAWFQSLAAMARCICFPKGRIRYLDATGEPKQSPLQGQAFFYFGPRGEEFGAVFSEFGVVR